MTTEPRPPQYRRCLHLILLVLLVAGCASAPPPGPTAEDVRQRAAEAERRVADDRPLAAARIYRQLAEESEGEEAQRWRLELIELLFDHGYPELALEHHRQLDTGPMPASLELRKRVADARAAVARQQGILALRLLPRIDRDMPADVQARIHTTRAQAYAQSGQPRRALQSRIRAEDQFERLDDPAPAIGRNHEAIWVLLNGLERETLETIAAEADTRTEQGWAGLALAQRSASSGQRPIDTAFADWHERHPRHPAADRFADELRERVISELTYPPRIDVLLPLSGPVAESARAIRDGMMAYYYDIPDYIQQPTMVFHDVGPEGMDIEEAYETAVDAGAGFVLGPLRRSAVTDLSRVYELPVPVLSLNYLAGDEPDPPANFHQFGLAPEDEARQSAAAAIRNNRFNALTLTPSNDWGDRLRQAFTEHFEELGGVVVETARYNPNATDYGNAIQALLNIDQSYARNRLLRSTIGTETRFEPRRRDDAEVIFLGARPRQARLAKPQLEFHRIGDIPIYATSHVFTGEPNPESDWDMNGLFFTEIPWILDRIETDDGEDGDGDSGDSGDTRRQRDRPASEQRHPRLFALGADALEILPLLEQLRAGSGNAHGGRTGRLTVNERGRVERELRWARFESGRPRPIDTPAIEVEELLGTEIRERADGED